MMPDAVKYACMNIESLKMSYPDSSVIISVYKYRVTTNEWTPFHTGFELFLIILGKKMPYWLGLGDSFAILYID